MKKKFISFREFGNTYGQARLNNLYVMRLEKKISSGALCVKNGNSFIDINFFIRRKKFKRDIWLKSHDNYFFLTLHICSSDLARLIYSIDSSHTLNSWIVFLNFGLFKTYSDNILNYKIDSMFYKFYRISRWLIRGLFILANVKPEDRDISVLLDRY